MECPWGEIPKLPAIIKSATLKSNIKFLNICFDNVWPQDINTPTAICRITTTAPTLQSADHPSSLIHTIVSREHENVIFFPYLKFFETVQHEDRSPNKIYRFIG